VLATLLQKTMADIVRCIPALTAHSIEWSKISRGLKKSPVKPPLCGCCLSSAVEPRDNMRLRQLTYKEATDCEEKSLDITLINFCSECSPE